MNNHSALHIIELSGSPRNRGQIHGESLRSIIQNGINQWKVQIGELLQIDPDQYLLEFLDKTDYLSAIKKSSPDLLQELEGLSEGTNLDFNQVFLWQLSFDESWHNNKEILRRKSRSGLCSAFAYSDLEENSSIVAQTSDLPYYFDGCQTLLKISYPNSEKRSMIFTIAGVLFQTGINNRGVCVVANSLPQLDYSLSGLPGSFFLRKILEAESVSKAVSFMRENKPAVGLNVIVGDGTQIVDLECSANVISEYSTLDSSSTICHTNHPLVNKDSSLFDNNYGYSHLDPLIDAPFPSNSKKRLEFLQTQLKNQDKSLSIENAKEILGSHEIPICFCRGYWEKNFTFGASIFQLGKELSFHLAPGPPGETQYQTFSF